MLIVSALLVVVPCGYFALLKWNELKEKKSQQSVVMAVFLAVVLIVAFLCLNLFNWVINHDERIVAQRYVECLIQNSIEGDEATFLGEVKTFAYEMDNTREVFETTVDSGFFEVPGLLISTSEAEDSEGNVYLYVLTQDLKMGLDVELKKSGDFYDIYHVTVLSESELSEVASKELFSPIW